MNVEEEVAALITRVGALERAVFAPFADHADPAATEATISAQRQRIAEKTYANRGLAEEMGEKVGGGPIDPPKDDGKPGDPATVVIGPG
jgi:hypothetical protein